MTNENAEELREWVTVTQAARVRGVSRQAVNYAIAHGTFKTLRVLGERKDGERPLFVLRRREVEKVREDRKVNG